MRILKPKTAEQALAALQETGRDVQFCAGGTALQVDWSQGKARPQALIDLSGLEALSTINSRGSTLHIGGMVTLSTLLKTELVDRISPMLVKAVKAVAAPAIRNRATIGGNVMWGSGCLLPALMALDAKLDLLTPSGLVTAPIVDWIKNRQSAALLLAIKIPEGSAQHRTVFQKIGLRNAFSPSVISVAARLELSEQTVSAIRFCIGGGTNAPSQLTKSEDQILGMDIRAIDWKNLETAIFDEIAVRDDPFRSASYKKKAGARALVQAVSSRLSARKRTQCSKRPRAAQRPDEKLLAHKGMEDDWHIRPDLPAKLSAEFPYLTDKRDDDMLVGAILRAEFPHARILSIDTREAEALPGVRAIVTHKDIKGTNAFGIVFQDQPALCFDKVRYLGDPVAGVAAINEATARKALSLIKVDYEPLPVVDGAFAALEADATPVHDNGNLVSTIELDRGDVEAGFAAAAHIVEDTYVTPRQMHSFMETEGGYVRPTGDGGIEVFVGGQHGARDRLQLSRILGLPEEKIEVITSPTGGAFGGKDELTVQPVLSLLALKAGLPVRMHLSRAESLLAGVKRNPMRIKMRTACDAKGRILAQEVDLVADCGAYASLSPAVMETALEHVCGPYLTDNVRSRGRLTYSNNGVCGAFRGFGANEMTYAIECQMDRLAKACGLDPITIRRRNLRAPGMPGFLGQKVAPTERLTHMLDAASASTLWNLPPEFVLDEYTGTGMAVNYQGNGLGSLPEDIGAGRLILSGDGRIEAHFGMDEMGQGLIPSICAAVSQKLGCAREDVSVIYGDTRTTPDSGSTTASRGGFVVWKAVELCAPSFTEKLLKAAADVLGRQAESLRIVPGGLGEANSNSGAPILSFGDLAKHLGPENRVVEEAEFPFPKTDYTKGNARFIFAFGATIARVAVNPVTGWVRVLDLELHTAAGPVIDLASYLGQMEGGAVQGLGFTLSEDILMEDGRHLTRNFDTYMLPGIRETPNHISVFALEDLDADDPFGPRGAGEIGIGAVTPAIANAVADALGQWPNVTPFKPEQILNFCGRSA